MSRGGPAADIDLKAAINAISDVIANRPRPIRLFDQIYMKAGDMVMQAEFVAHWADNRRLAFIGDGDAISVCVAYLHARNILGYGPSKITVFDFDERIVGAVNRFADKERLELLSAELYNCLDAFPRVGHFDCFYTNPPWGASNDGESVSTFLTRGVEAVGGQGEGLVVIADSDELEWPQEVLAKVQHRAAKQGFFVRRMSPLLHSYHLDDAPDLLSCNLLLRSVPQNAPVEESCCISEPDRLANFYGRNQSPRVRYIRELKTLDYGKAHDDEYELELLGGES